MADPAGTTLREDLAAGFAGAEDDVVVDDVVEPSAVDAGVQDTPAPDAVSGDPDVLQAPQHWSEADRTLFVSAPRPVQERWLAREQETERGFNERGQQLSQLKKDRESWDEIFGTIDQELKLSGTSRHQFVQNLVAWNDYIAKNPLEGLRRLAQQFGVDAKALTENPSNTDPAVSEALKRVDALSQKLTERESREQQQALERNRAAVESFANAKGEDGKPLHPYFEDVAEDMLRILRADRRLSLDTAYQKALRLNDAVWEKTQAERKVTSEAEKERARQQQVEKAKRAAVGSEGDGTGTTKPKTLRDELAAGFAGWAA